MRILFLNHNFYEQGTYWRCIFLARYLVRMGHDIIIVARSKNSKVHRCSKWGVETIFFPGWKTQWLMRLPLVIGTNFDLIHIFAAANFCNTLPGLFARLFKGVQILVDWDDWYTRGGFIQGKPWVPIITMMEEKLPTLASAVTVVSEALRRRALSCGVEDEKIFKIENGSNVDDIRVLSKNESRRKLSINNSPIMLYLGSYPPEIEFLLRVIKDVRDMVKEVKLMVVGCQGSCTDLVSFFGRVDHEKVQYYLAAADVLCMPMNDSLVERARWPIKLGDYMASGRPIVGSNVGEVGRILREVDNGLVSNPNKPSDMASNIVSLLKDETRSAELGGKIRRLAERKYAWKLIADRLEIVYKEVIA